MTVFIAPPPMGHYALTGLDRAPILPPDVLTELNYGPPPRRVVRTRTLGIMYYAGLMQRGMTQWFYTAFLAPPPIPRRSNSAAAIGGVLGATTVAQATSHIPSARVPRSIT